MKNERPGSEPRDDRDQIRSRVVAVLEEMGYGRDQMAFDELFRLDAGEGEMVVPIEILVSVDGRPGLLVKCIHGPTSGRQEAAVALARLFPGGPVPFAAVANETGIVVIETCSRAAPGRWAGSIPGQTEIRSRFRDALAGPRWTARRERDMRVLAAYVHLRCPVPKAPY